jgi:hypothetical protein
MKKNRFESEYYTRTELIIESVAIGIATGVAVIVLSTGYVLLWSMGEAIWKTLIK